MNLQNKLTKRECLLLSAYLDGECNSNERKKVEKLLQDNSAAKEYLEKINTAKNLLGLLPTRKVPYDFTLTRSEAAYSRPSKVVAGLRITSAISALFLGVLYIFNALPNAGTPMVAMESAPPAEAPRSIEKDSENDDGGSAPIITFQGGVPQGAGIGMGGGGGEPSMPSQDGQVILPDIVIVGGASELDSTISESAENIPETYQSQGEAAEDSIVEEQTGPILGIRPKDEQGAFSTEIIFPEEEEPIDLPKPSSVWIRNLQIGAILISTVTLILSFTIRRQKTKK